MFTWFSSTGILVGKVPFFSKEYELQQWLYGTHVPVLSFRGIEQVYLKSRSSNFDFGRGGPNLHEWPHDGSMGRTVYLPIHGWLIFKGIHVGKYTIFPWILWVLVPGLPHWFSKVGKSSTQKRQTGREYVIVPRRVGWFFEGTQLSITGLTRLPKRQTSLFVTNLAGTISKQPSNFKLCRISKYRRWTKYSNLEEKIRLTPPVPKCQSWTTCAWHVMLWALISVVHPSQHLEEENNFEFWGRGGVKWSRLLIFCPSTVLIEASWVYLWDLKFPWLACFKIHVHITLGQPSSKLLRFSNPQLQKPWWNKSNLTVAPDNNLIQLHPDWSDM